MKSIGSALSAVVIILYLTSVLGVGRYSCFCDHASEISFMGISTECSCTHEEQEADPCHHCSHCGHKLEVQTIDRADCCSVKYFFLDSDQNTFSDSFKIFISEFPVIKMTEGALPFGLSFLNSRIKTFQALFYIDPGPLFIKFSQFIL